MGRGQPISPEKRTRICGLLRECPDLPIVEIAKACAVNRTTVETVNREEGIRKRKK